MEKTVGRVLAAGNVAYLDAWCRVTDVVRGKVTDWLPYIAAARLTENVPGEFDRLLEIAQS